MKVHEIPVPLVDNPLGPLTLLVLHLQHVLDVVPLVGQLPLVYCHLEGHTLLGCACKSSCWVDVVVYYLDAFDIKLARKGIKVLIAHRLLFAFLFFHNAVTIIIILYVAVPPTHGVSHCGWILYLLFP